ncbi:MAG: DTW domain-containing protein [Proteobacteria bacterium]|nr:MAG: DTW domain-containing protein [Pseudomonadota bacterium]
MPKDSMNPLPLKLAPAPDRGYCLTCRRAPLTCYCKWVQRFDPKIEFVILIHGREAQKRIATGRISHLCLEGSHLIQGYDYTNDTRVNAIIADPLKACVVLYPGDGSVILNEVPEEKRPALIPPGKKLVVFVIDGTWITARKTMQRSQNLMALPRVCFDPDRPSRFRVRKQPQENFFSTVEAIHETIELLGNAAGFNTAERKHDALLRVFDEMVEQQLVLSAQPKRYCHWAPPKGSVV